jgi:hypothetical protein
MKANWRRTWRKRTNQIHRRDPRSVGEICESSGVHESLPLKKIVQSPRSLLQPFDSPRTVNINYYLSFWFLYRVVK